MERVATDGARLVVTGMVFDLPIALGQNGYRALWTSDDGVTWMRVDARAGELLPDVIASTSTGWVGARSTSDGPQFLVSQDGMAWDATTAPGEMGAGIVTDLAASTDGMVVAIGDDTAANTDGTLSRAAVVSWRGDDGRMWHRSPPQPSLGGSYPNVAHGSAVIAAGTGWIAVGMVRGRGRGVEVDRWSDLDEPAVIDAAGFGSVDAVAEADGQLVALGTDGGCAWLGHRRVDVAGRPDMDGGWSPFRPPGQRAPCRQSRSDATPSSSSAVDWPSKTTRSASPTSVGRRRRQPM